MKENKIFASLKMGENTDREAFLEEAMGLIKAGAEGLCVYDESETDKSHDENINSLKALCAGAGVPVYAGGNIKRLEDVKKILYAGCEGVIMPQGDKELLDEAKKRFGSEESEDKSRALNDISWDKLKKGGDGLVPCIVQDYTDGTVLMLAYMNREAYETTLTTGRMTYFSRSRNKLWEKGEESGHTQYMKSLTTDCDMDTLLAVVKQIGPACHTGARSCFFNNIVGEINTGASGDVFNEVYEIIIDRRDNPKEGSYTNYLFDKGIDKVLKKVGEESTEIIIAAKNPEREEIIYEISDFLYHVSVLMAMKGVTWEEIKTELKNR